VHPTLTNLKICVCWVSMYASNRCNGTKQNNMNGERWLEKYLGAKINSDAG